jgi:hypothetical protein
VDPDGAGDRGMLEAITYRGDDDPRHPSARLTTISAR